MSIGIHGGSVRETFRMVPDRLWLDRRLTANEVRLWCALLFTARGRDFTDATDVALAEQIGASPQSVRRSLLRLEECRFISRERTGQGRAITLNPAGDGGDVPELGLKVIG